MDNLISGSKQFCRISNFLEEKAYDVYQLFHDTCMFSALTPRGGGMTFLLPEDWKDIRKLIDDDDTKGAVECLNSCIIDMYLPTTAEWEKFKSDIPNKLRKKVPVEKVEKGKITLKGGAVLTPNKEFTYYGPGGKEGVAVWNMKGFYSSTEGGYSKKRSHKRGHRGGAGAGDAADSRTPFKIRMDLFEKCVMCYQKHLADPHSNPDYFLIVASNALLYLSDNNLGHTRVSNINGCDAGILAHLVWYPSPVATFMALIEPGRSNLHNPIIPDECMAHFDSIACFVSSSGDSLARYMAYGNAACGGSGVICQDPRKYDSEHYKMIKELCRSMSTSATGPELRKIYTTFQNENRVGSLSGVEPQAEHDFLYGKVAGRDLLAFRKTFFDETFYACSVVLPDIANEIVLAGAGDPRVGAIVMEADRFLRAQIDRTRQDSYEDGCGVLGTYGQLTGPSKFISLAGTFVSSGCAMYEPLSQEIVSTRTISVADIAPPPCKPYDDLDNQMWQRLARIPNVEVAESNLQLSMAKIVHR